MHRFSWVVGLTALALTAGTAAAPGTVHVGVPSSRPSSGSAYAVAVSTPVEDPYYPQHGDPRVDTLHYDLDLRWDAGRRRLDGKAKIVLRAARSTDVIQLDLGDPLHVTSVLLDGHRAMFDHPGDVLRVHHDGLAADSRHRLTVKYHGRPQPVHAPTTRSDFEDLGWTIRPNGTIWTMQEPFGAYTWYPVNDQPSDKAFYDIRIDAPAAWVGIANGELTSRQTAAGRTVTTWHLTSPAASYLTTIAIGDYKRYTDTGPHALPVTYWLPRRAPDRWLTLLRKTPAMMRWLETKLGPYPFDRIGAVVVPSDSAMETQTMVTMGSGAMGRSDAKSVILHELAHQWYGDTVTPTTWPDLWLNESFAMYIEDLWDSEHGGYPMSLIMDLYRQNDEAWRTSDGPPGAWRKSKFGEGCVYFCGALVLWHLRTRLGPDAFDAALRAWPQEHGFAGANRQTYFSWLRQQTGEAQGPWLRRVLNATSSPWN